MINTSKKIIFTANSPPDLGKAAPNSAYVAAPHKEAMPPIIHSIMRAKTD